MGFYKTDVTCSDSTLLIYDTLFRLQLQLTDLDEPGNMSRFNKGIIINK